MNAELEVLHGNGHNEGSLVDYLEGASWDAASVCEVDRLTVHLRQIPNARVRTSGASFDRARDTAVLVRDRFPSHGGSTTQVSRALGRNRAGRVVNPQLNRVAPGRVMVEERFEHPLAAAAGAAGIALFCLHPNAGPKQLNTKARLARRLGNRLSILVEYRKSWKKFREAWNQAKRDGYLCVGTSDAQMTAGSRRPWSPGVQARRLGAKSWSHSIDWIFYDARLELAGEPELHKLFDHYGFRSRLRLARKTSAR